MPDSPTGPLWDALGKAIDQGVNPPLDVDGEPILRTPRVYRGRTEPDGAGELPSPGYFLLGMPVETEQGWYNGEAGQDGLFRIHCWASTPDDAQRLYQWVKALIHRVPLAVAGYEPVSGILSKSGPLPDATGGAWQVQASYDTEAKEAAA